MKLRTILITSAVVASLGAAALGVLAWHLPPPLQPEFVYRLRYGDRFPASRPAGDGRLVDVGPRVADGRYWVDLGPVDDEAHVDRRFRVGPLPEATFTVGLNIVCEPCDRDIKFARPDIGRARVEVTTAAGDPVMAAGGRLPRWTWSGPLARSKSAFVYPLINPPHKPDEGDAVEATPSSFRAVPGGIYAVRVVADWSVPAVDSYRIRLAIKGGGYLDR